MGEDETIIDAALRQEFGDGPIIGGRQGLPPSVGPFRVVRQIGIGGMGIVYEAEQRQPERRVALKVIRNPSLVDARRTRLFRREIEVLGRFKHPSIAQIYDAGQTDDGVPYFAMELVHGQPVTAYCDLAGLPVRERLSLFARICDAVHYAHQRGVIHRDIKPHNILIDDDGNPRILDFGLAAMLDPNSNLALSMDHGQALIGTLPYMSPEQTCGDAGELDVRTDIYSLGVVLYEMLTGTYPYEVTGRIADVLRNIAEATPKPPSSLQRRIGDEVETIILRSLDKEKPQRYQSAETLSDDVRRYLDGLPIHAKRHSALYVLRKTAARHAYATAALAMLATTIVAFGAISLRLYLRTERALREKIASDSRAAAADQQLASLADGLPAAVHEMRLGWFLAEWDAGRLERARAIRDRTPEGIGIRKVMDWLLDSALSEEKLLDGVPPESRQLALFAIGEGYRKSGRPDEAKDAYESCVSIQPGSWFADSAVARIEELRSPRSKAEPNGARR